MNRAFAGVTEQIEHLLAGAGVPGRSVALVDRSSMLWSAGIGWADVLQKCHATSRTVYHLFSGTKLFTATAILQLADKGRLALEDSVGKFVADPTGTLGAITLRDLLSHQSDLRDSLRAFMAVSFPPDPLTPSSAALARYPIRAARPPRQRVQYRNVNYAPLGEVVTRVSGIEYTKYVEESVLKPLGMHARFGLDPTMSKDAATGYTRRWDPMRVLLWALFPGMRGRLYGHHIGGLMIHIADELKRRSLRT